MASNMERIVVPGEADMSRLRHPRPNLGPDFIRALSYLSMPHDVTRWKVAYLTYIAPM
jgi:hypothetical protein